MSFSTLPFHMNRSFLCMSVAQSGCHTSDKIPILKTRLLSAQGQLTWDTQKVLCLIDALDADINYTSEFSVYFTEMSLCVNYRDLNSVLDT